MTVPRSVEPATGMHGPADAASVVPEWATERAVLVFDLLVDLLERQNPDFFGHSLRVADLAATIAATLGLDEAGIEHVRLAGRLHDLGMLAIPASVLAKAGPLTQEEMFLVRLHPQLGAQLASAIVPPPVVAMIRGHHERWDGGGYPDGLRGNEIPLGARILAVAEVFDALHSSRPYRPEFPKAVAFARLAALATAALDPDVVAATVATLGRHDAVEILPDPHPAVAEANLRLWLRPGGSTSPEPPNYVGQPHLRPERL